MISLVRFRIGVLIQVRGIFPRPGQLLQAVFLLLGGRDQLLSLDLLEIVLVAPLAAPLA
jgi:hypothetical protein